MSGLGVIDGVGGLIAGTGLGLIGSIVCTAISDVMIAMSVPVSTVVTSSSSHSSIHLLSHPSPLI